MRALISFSLFVVLCTSCGETSALLVNTSANGKTTITVIGKRTFSLDAWQVELKVRAYSFKEDQLAFEVNASALNSDNVAFNWTDDDHCEITFTQSDDSKRIFYLTSSPDGIEMTGM